jgi:hypothetical protein
MSIGKPVIIAVTPHGPPNSYLANLHVKSCIQKPDGGKLTSRAGPATHLLFYLRPKWCGRCVRHFPLLCAAAMYHSGRRRLPEPWYEDKMKIMYRMITQLS